MAKFEFTIYKPYSNDPTNPYEKVEIDAYDKLSAHSKMVSRIKAYLKNGDNSWVDANITKMVAKD